MFSSSGSGERNEHCLYGATNNTCGATNQEIISSSDGTLTNKLPVFVPGIESSDSASIPAEMCVEHGEILQSAINNNHSNSIIENVKAITGNHASNYVEFDNNSPTTLDFTHHLSSNANNNNNNKIKSDATTWVNNENNTRYRQNHKSNVNNSTIIEINENISESAIENDLENNDTNNNNNNGSAKSCWNHYNAFFMTIVKWWMITLLLLFLTFMVFGFIYRGVFRPIDNCDNNNSSGKNDNHTNDDITKNSSKCVQPFGTMLGVNQGVIAFSNCNSEFVSYLDNNISRNNEKVESKAHMLNANGTTGVNYFQIVHNEHIHDQNKFNSTTNAYTTATLHSREMSALLSDEYYGMKWQCVEYARRYWMLRGKPEPAYFDDVDGAADIWNKKKVHAVSDATVTYKLKKFANGASIMNGGGAPQERDLIIYERQDNIDFAFGHVAVIVQVEWNVSKRNSLVYIAEQNWENDLWPAPFYNYSRVLTLTYNSQVLSYSITDTTGKILGWVRYG